MASPEQFSVRIVARIMLLRACSISPDIQREEIESLLPFLPVPEGGSRPREELPPPRLNVVGVPSLQVDWRRVHIDGPLSRELASFEATLSPSTIRTFVDPVTSK